jgi:hypothetical protein
VTTTESSKVFVKEEIEEDEEEIFPSFYPTISVDEDPLKRQVLFSVLVFGRQDCIAISLLLLPT